MIYALANGIGWWFSLSILRIRWTVFSSIFSFLFHSLCILFLLFRYAFKLRSTNLISNNSKYCLCISTTDSMREDSHTWIKHTKSFRWMFCLSFIHPANFYETIISNQHGPALQFTRLRFIYYFQPTFFFRSPLWVFIYLMLLSRFSAATNCHRTLFAEITRRIFLIVSLGKKWRKRERKQERAKNTQ